ncbi:MAG: argininosuccinate lyase [Chloroflexi bacterium]|nr:argininosuccinate lyase [Chloroflexota bacterium]
MIENEPEETAIPAKLWGGRFRKALDQRALRYTTSLPVDRRLFRHDVLGSMAHAAMLGRQGIIPAGHARALVHGLADLLANPPDLGDDTGFEDVHSLVEAAITLRLGADVGGRLHTARSRNDQVATDARLWAREALLQQLDALLGLQRAFCDAAQQPGLEAILPGYTHLQRAQPVLLGHHLLAYVEQLERDTQRLRETYARVDVLPLGAGALAGSSFPLDRAYVAELLGMRGGVTRNSLDAVSDRDFIAEHVAHLALIAMHLSRLAEELVLWSTSEFGFVQLDEGYTTGSSMMPQKRNPDVAELLRGKTGRVYGALVGVLTVLKGLPLSYNRDLQEDKGAYFDAVETVTDGLALAAAMIETAHWRTARMAAAADDPLIAATDLADHLARRGVPFREAHEVAGRLVKAAESSGRSLADLSLEELRQADPRFEVEAVGPRPEGLVAARTLIGGTAATRVSAEIGAARDRLDAHAAWVESARASLPTPERILAALG